MRAMSATRRVLATSVALACMVAASACAPLDDDTYRTAPAAPAWTPGHTYESDPGAMDYARIIDGTACPVDGDGTLVVDASGKAVLTVQAKGDMVIASGGCKLRSSDSVEASVIGTAREVPGHGGKLSFSTCNKVLGVAAQDGENVLLPDGGTNNSTFLAHVSVQCTDRGSPSIRVSGTLHEVTR